MLDWDDLRTVLEVHREGTLTHAATRLAVTRTTVGRRLKQAEERLGVRLFDRTPEGLSVTEAGHDLVQTALRVEEEVLASENRLLGRKTDLRGPLRITTVDFVYEAIAPVFASFVERYPSVEVTVLDEESPASLLRREADIALRVGNKPAEHLVGRRLLRLRFAVYAARSLADRVGPGASLADWPWLHWDERKEEARWFDHWLAEQAPGARVVMRCSTFPVLRRSIRAGIGVLFLPKNLGDADPDLVPIGKDLEGEDREVWALTLADLRPNPRVRAFMDHAYDALAD
ncbi:MAG: LysR family transcriptional regulator [Myxococcota bacterium]